jgi:hypothetical protein
VTLRRTALVLALLLFLVYNSNGREIGSIDTQPAKYAARELALRGSLRLGHVVGERPGLGERPAFTRDRQGNWRSAYPVVPALLGGAVASVLSFGHIIDLDAPLAPNLIAVVTASLLTACAVALVFLALARIVPPGAALITAVGLGAGTNYWPLVSRALSQQETVAFGCALALWAGLRPDRPPTAREAFIGGIGLALAGAARPQVAPMVALMAMWLVLRNRRYAVLVAIPIAAAAVMSMGTNWHWFGNVLGGASRLQEQHWANHAVHGSFSRKPWIGLAGLLISPSRGLLIFSPIVAIAALGVRRGLRRRELGLPWLLAAALVQLGGYACYTVWWGGHSYGPRFLLDILVPLTPFAAIACADVIARSWPLRIAAGAVLAWSVAVAALGAFVYPNDAWNSDPLEVDVHHARLWDTADSQIPRAWHSHASPQNFDLFTRAAVRRVE